MGTDVGKDSFLKQIKQNKKLVRRLIVVGSTFLALVLFVKACSSNGNGSSSSASTSLRKRGESPFFASPPPTPAIVWLMTMPSSGSSFVMSLVARASQLSMATNYGEDVTEKDQYSISIDPRESIGPYWPGLGDRSSKAERKLPTNNVLVQTYCRQKSTPHVPTFEEYIQDCTTTFGRSSPDVSQISKHSYPPSRVKKAIHLIRNPFHQIITKFQKEYKSHVKDKQWRSMYPETKKGFEKWCKDADAKTASLDTEYFSASTVEVMQSTACSRYIAEYVTWHNMAFATCAHLRIPEMVMYYEDLLDDAVETTLDGILDFVELEKDNMPPQRLGEEEEIDVDNFLSRDDQKQIRRLVQKLATDETWKRIELYFKDVM